MIKIGELSKITNTPVKTIRFYEEEGLISPVEVDRWTSYRYYDDSSINRLSEIAYLKDLGFSLKEIRNMDEQVVANKLAELNEKLIKITKNIRFLSHYNKGGIVMKNFVNDKQVIGKWKRLGVVARIEDFKQKKFKRGVRVFEAFKELYFLPGGAPYWSLAWSKGKLFVRDMEHEYKIIEGKLFVFVKDRYSKKVDDIVVYEQVDNKEYTEDEISIKDDTNLPFIMDKRVVGVWNSIDCIDKREDFNENANENYALKTEIFEKDGRRKRIWKDNTIDEGLNWTKNYLIDARPTWNTVSEYEIIEKNGETFMIVEWKSGDYLYGGKINCYYVFKKVQ